MTTQIDPQHEQQHHPMSPYYRIASDSEIDLRELWNVIWRGKWWILMFTIIFSVGSVAFALSKPNIYRAEVLLAPSSADSNKMGGIASQFGGLAALAGINMGGGGGDKTKLALAILQSRAFLTDFIKNNGLLVPIFAGKAWNPKSGELLLDDEVYSVQTGQWAREVKPGNAAQPTDWEAYKEFKPMLTVSQDNESGLLTLAVDFLSPVMAKQWVDGLVNALNRKMKTMDLEEADKSIAYLRQQLEKTSVTEMQNVFFELIEEQMKTKMLAEVQEEYVFKVVDPAVIAEEKIKPKRALIAVLGTILGGIIGVIVVFICHFAFGHKHPDQQS